MKLSRKNFIRTLGGSALATLGTAGLPTFGAAAPTSPKRYELKFGLASYTVREFSLEESIQMALRLKLPYICLKSMHLPLDSSKKDIEAAAKKVRDAGLDLYGGGVIYMKSEEAVNQTFEYAKHAGMRVIVGVPNHDLLDLVDKKVKEYDIKVAIHNHGPGDDVYPSPDSIYEKIKHLDKRIGICMDIGHTERIEMNCSAKARQFKDRIYDIHLKDVDRLGAAGKSVELGRGIINIPEFLKTLRMIGYQGIVSLEYEKNGKDPLPGMAESIGYARGVLDVMAG